MQRPKENVSVEKQYCGVYSASCLRLFADLADSADLDVVFRASIQPVVIHKTTIGKSVTYYLRHLEGNQAEIQAKLLRNNLHLSQLFLNDGTTPITPSHKVQCTRSKKNYVKYSTIINGEKIKMITKDTYRHRLSKRKDHDKPHRFIQDTCGTKRHFEETVDKSEKDRESKTSRLDKENQSSINLLAMSSRFFNCHMNDRHWEADVKLSTQEVNFFYSQQANNSGVIVVSQNPDESFHLTIDRSRNL